MKLIYKIIFSTLLALRLTNAQADPVTASTNKDTSSTSEVVSPMKPLFRSESGGVTSILFVGDGNIQKSFTDGSAINANTGIGVIFNRRWGTDRLLQNIDLDFSINIASTSDTIKAVLAGQSASQTITNRRRFGEYLLIPRNSGQATNLNMNIFFGGYEKYKFSRLISGANLKFTASNNVWRVDKDSYNLSGMAIRVGIFHELMPDNLRFSEDNQIDYSITFGIYRTFRLLYGDLSSTVNESVRTQVLGSTDTKYSGWEIGLGFRLKNLRAEVQIPMLKGDSMLAIPGLTNTQFITSITFVGGFPISLNKKSSKEDNDNN